MYLYLCAIYQRFQYEVLVNTGHRGLVWRKEHLGHVPDTAVEMGKIMVFSKLEHQRGANNAKGTGNPGNEPQAGSPEAVAGSDSPDTSDVVCGLNLSILKLSLLNRRQLAPCQENRRSASSAPPGANPPQGRQAPPCAKYEWEAAFFGRARLNNGKVVVPGYVVPSHGVIHTGYDLWETVLQEYEVLCEDQPCSLRYLASKAIRDLIRQASEAKTGRYKLQAQCKHSIECLKALMTGKVSMYCILRVLKYIKATQIQDRDFKHELPPIFGLACHHSFGCSLLILPTD